MPHSPLNDDPAAPSAEAYVAAWDATQLLLKQGRSWSGYERNCAFLNVNGRRFANQSAVSGLDFLDDGRGLAVTDWDHDGDLDLWLSNRSSPRVRFMRNQTPTDQGNRHFVAFKLRGTTANRDAIGSRVELEVSGSSAARRIQTLYAGDAFVSQSSKWIHFGLGDLADDARIRSVVVRWPGGNVETFPGVARGRRYELVEGDGRSIEWRPPARQLKLTPSEQPPAEPASQSRVVLPARIPLPVLSYTRIPTATRPLTKGDVRKVETNNEPLLLSFWASWCAQCQRELYGFAKEYESIQAAGLNILALSVDGLDPQHDTGPADALEFIAKARLPFPTGMTTTQTLEKLELIHGFLFHRLSGSSTLPLSYLLDERGEFAAIYRGVIGVQTLLADVKKLSAPPAELRDRSLPFPGRWFSQVPFASIGHLAGQFKDRYTDDYLHYLRLASNQQEKLYAEAPANRRPDIAEYLARLHAHLATALLGLQKPAAAIRHQRRVVELLPDSDSARANLNGLLATHGRPEEALANLRRAHSENPASTSIRHNLAQTLRSLGHLEEATTHFEAILSIDPGDVDVRFDYADLLVARRQVRTALQQYEEVLRHDATHVASRMRLASFLSRQGEIDEAIRLCREALQLKSDHGDAHRQLGVLLHMRGEVGAAIQHLLEATRLLPESAGAFHAAGWILATSVDDRLRRPKEALQLAQKAVHLTERRDPAVLDTLAAAYAAGGEFQQAVTTAKQALSLATAGKKNELAGQIRERLAYYRQGRPYREE